MPPPPGVSQSKPSSRSSRGRSRGATATGPGRSSSGNRGSGRGPGGPGRGGRSGQASQGGYSGTRGRGTTYNTPSPPTPPRASNFGTYGTTETADSGGQANPVAAAMMNEGEVKETGNPSMPFGEIGPGEYRQINREIVKDTDRDVFGKFIKSLPFVGDMATAAGWAGMHPGFDDPVASDVASAYANSTLARLFGDHSSDPNIQAGVQALFDGRRDRNAARTIENARKAGVWIPDNVPVGMQLTYARSGRAPASGSADVYPGQEEEEVPAAVQAATEAANYGIYTPPYRPGIDPPRHERHMTPTP